MGPAQHLRGPWPHGSPALREPRRPGWQRVFSDSRISWARVASADSETPRKSETDPVTARTFPSFATFGAALEDAAKADPTLGFRFISEDGVPGFAPEGAERGLVLVHRARARERPLRRRAPGARPQEGRPRRADPPGQRGLRPLLLRRDPRGHRPGADLPAARPRPARRATSTTRATSSRRAARGRSSRPRRSSACSAPSRRRAPALEQVVAVEAIRESLEALKPVEGHAATTSPSSSSRAAPRRAPRA